MFFFREALVGEKSKVFYMNGPFSCEEEMLHRETSVNFNEGQNILYFELRWYREQFVLRYISKGLFLLGGKI